MRSFTKELMMEALKNLLKTKPLNKITVNDIVSECDASKQTFYNHFQDKYALFTYTLTTVLKDNLEHAARNSLDYRSTIHSYYDAILLERDFYRSIIRDEAARELISSCIIENSEEYFRELVRKKTRHAAIPAELELSIMFNAAGDARLLVDWIQSGMVQSTETMAAVNFDCIPQCLREYC